MVSPSEPHGFQNFPSLAPRIVSLLLSLTGDAILVRFSPLSPLRILCHEKNSCTSGEKLNRPLSPDSLTSFVIPTLWRRAAEGESGER